MKVRKRQSTPESAGDAPEDEEQTGKESRPGDGDDLTDEGEDP